VTAMTKFISSPTWERNKRYSAEELFSELAKVSFGSAPWWIGKKICLDARLAPHVPRLPQSFRLSL